MQQAGRLGGQSAQVLSARLGVIAAGLGHPGAQLRVVESVVPPESEVTLAPQAERGQG